jgi:hypothetical protein
VPIRTFSDMASTTPVAETGDGIGDLSTIGIGGAWRGGVGGGDLRNSRTTTMARITPEMDRSVNSQRIIVGLSNPANLM